MRLGEYRIDSLIEIHDKCSRYRGCTESTNEVVEIRILNKNWFAKHDAESIGRKLKLSMFVEGESIVRLKYVETQRDPPFVVLEPLPMLNLAKRQAERPLMWDEIGPLALSVASAIKSAHRLGLILGNLSANIVFQTNDNRWKIDITSLLDHTESTEERSVDEAFLPPEAKFHRTLEMPGDIYAATALIQWLIQAAPDGTPDLVHRAKSLLDAGLANEPAERPTAIELVDSAEQVFASAELLPQQKKQLTHAEHVGGTVELELKLDRTMEVEVVAAPPVARFQRLGRFDVYEKLGEGGMGSVYRGKDIVDQRDVALKVLRRERQESSHAQRRFAKEARLLARANNPYVANLLEFNADAGVEYLAVEYVGGGSLGDILRNHGSVPEQIALILMCDAARGLAIAHQRGVVHRDIKPDNLLLTEPARELLRSVFPVKLDAGTADTASLAPVELGASYPVLVKVTDFGLASHDRTTDSLAITTQGAVLGTPLYMSPEQCRGEKADSRSDIYSLGATFFQMLAGKVPFDGESNIDVMQKHCHEPLPTLKQFRPDLSEATIRVVEKCLAKNPDARYVDGAELAIDLENLIRGEPTAIVTHPVFIATADDRALQYTFSWDLESSPQMLWPYISNTDRVNHAMGLPSVRYTVRKDPIRGIERFAQTKIAGQIIAWQEHPYEWIEGKRLSVLREFSKGPFEWFVNVVEIEPRVGGGSRVSQTLKILPRSMLGRILANWELGRKSKKAFGKTYEQIDRYLTQGGATEIAADAFGKRTELSPSKKGRLLQRLDRLREARIDPVVVDSLGQFLEHASDIDVARIRPLAFAHRFQLDPQQVVQACLLGAREGLLTLLWDILCPSCRIPADVQETLKSIKDHGYCEACDIQYELDFAKSVELIFRAHPELRQAETKTYCIGGPAWSAHVVAQVRLAAGERFTAEMALTEGTYRIRGPQLPFSVDFRVGQQGSLQGVQGRWELSLSRAPVRDLVPTMREGSQVLVLFNDTSRDLQIKIERTASRQDAFTAAQASSLALFREMFPDQILSSGQIVSVAHTCMLAAQISSASKLYQELGDGAAFAKIRELLSSIDEIIKTYRGAVVKTIGDGVLATFSDSVNAAIAAMEIQKVAMQRSDLQGMSVALHSGPAMVTTLNDRLDYFGNTVHQLMAMLDLAADREIITTDEFSSLPEISQACLQRGWKLSLLEEAQLSNLVLYRWQSRSN